MENPSIEDQNVVQQIKDEYNRMVLKNSNYKKNDSPHKKDEVVKAKPSYRKEMHTPQGTSILSRVKNKKLITLSNEKSFELMEAAVKNVFYEISNTKTFVDTDDTNPTLAAAKKETAMNTYRDMFLKAHMPVKEFWNTLIYNNPPTPPTRYTVVM